MKKEITRTLLSLISAILLFVTVTYAWIIGGEMREAKLIRLDFTGKSSLRYVTESIDVTMYFMDHDTGEYVEAESSLILDGIVPNEMVPFKILFRNQSGTTQTVSLSITGVKTSNPAILDYMYIGLSAGSGYIMGSKYTPDNVFLCLSESTHYESSDTYQLTLYQTLSIPNTGSESVELKGYFWFHSEAEASLAGTSLEITHLRVVL